MRSRSGRRERRGLERRWGWTPVVVALLGSFLLPVTGGAQEIATGTRADRGAAWGAAVGGVLGGLGIGVLTWGLCDAADCDGSFGEGFAVGAVLGGATGATAGLVVGSAFPRGGPAVGGWSLTARAGARGALARDVDGVGPALGLTLARGVTERVRVGGTVEYLGRAEEISMSSFTDRDGNRYPRTRRRGWILSSVRMEAERVLSPGARRSGWLSAGFGVYPTRESFEESAVEGLPRRPISPYKKWVPAPGLAFGGGLRVQVAERWSVDLGGHADLVVGVGSNDWLPLLRAGVGVRRDPPHRL